MVDEKTIEELRALLAKATPGPWEVDYLDKNGQRVIRQEHIEIATFWHHSVGSIEKEMEANAALVVAMRNALPDLLDAAERAEKNLQHAAIMHAERDMAIESASRAREDALREAVEIAEAYADEQDKTVRASVIAAAIRALIDKPKGGDARRTIDGATVAELSAVTFARALAEHIDGGVPSADTQRRVNAGVRDCLDEIASLPAAPVDGGEDA